MRKRLIFIIVCAAVLFQSISASAVSISSDAAYVIDALTGECYYEFNAEAPLAPASMTKVMTVYILYEKMRDGVISKETMITADEEDAAASRDSEATNVLLDAGKSYSVGELIGAILVPSACAASAMAGKYLCGSEREFAGLMNDTAARLGLNAYYEDASGLSDSNRITASSMARLSRLLVNEFPDVLNYTSMPYIIFGGRRYNSTNHMLSGDSYEYAGVDGLKTGTTTLAGYCFTSTAVRDGIRLITVTMHSKTGSRRFTDSAELLNYGFERANTLYNNILATDMRIYINGEEIPAFRYGGPNSGLTFIIEDLKDYGFSIGWNDEEKTVTAYYDSSNEVTPIPMEMYRGYSNGSALFGITANSGITAQIEYNGDKYTFERVYSLDGYMAVSADELINIADECTWDEQTRSLNIVFGR